MLLGNGDTTLVAPKSFASMGQTSGAMVVADFNGDCKPDYAVTNNHSNNVVVFLNTSR